MIMSKAVRPEWGSRDKIEDTFPVLTISEFDIELIKMLLCSVAKVLRKFDHVVKIDCLVKTLSTDLHCTFRKSYTVTTWTPITSYKLVEYHGHIHLILFRKNHAVMNVLWSSSMTFFFVCNLFVVRFAATWKVRIWGLYKDSVQKVKEYRNLIFCLNLI